MNAKAQKIVPRHDDDPKYQYSAITLRFEDAKTERAYRDYRNPRILRYLRWLLLAGSALVFVGSIIDFSRMETDDAMALTAVRISAAFGMLIAWWMTRLDWVKANTQMFILVGASLNHCLFLVSVPIMGERIVDYTGVLPINIMVTFIVSGLMFRFSVYVGAAAVVAYTLVLLNLHPSPVAPILYMVVGSVYAGFAAYVAEQARREAWADSEALEAEKRNSDRLLLNVLPPSIASRMKGGEGLIADRFDDACVLFADIVGFTKMSATMKPEELVNILDDIFKRFDTIAIEMDLEKIKTIGDCYMVAAGMPSERSKDPYRIAEAALRMQRELDKVARKLNRDLQIRVGIHCGPVVAGVIGHSKFIYDLWGDTVNLASRMESTAANGTIQLSESMADRLRGSFDVAFNGEREMKGKGLQPVYILNGKIP
jgi:class 3 adenylate cyclase